MEIIRIIRQLKIWGASIGIPVIAIFLYQVHLERIESLQDEIELLHEKVKIVYENEKITRCDNAVKIIESQRKFHAIEIVSLTKTSSKLEEDVKKIDNKNQFLITQANELKVVVQSLSINNKNKDKIIEKNNKIILNMDEIIENNNKIILNKDEIIENNNKIIINNEKIIRNKDKIIENDKAIYLQSLKLFERKIK